MAQLPFGLDFLGRLDVGARLRQFVFHRGFFRRGWHLGNVRELVNYRIGLFLCLTRTPREVSNRIFWQNGTKMFAMVCSLPGWFRGSPLFSHLLSDESRSRKVPGEHFESNSAALDPVIAPQYQQVSRSTDKAAIWRVNTRSTKIQKCLSGGVSFRIFS